MGGKNDMARGRPLIRQWNLLKAIQNHRFGINTDDLTERGECSKRQILRDINILQDAGFPINYETREGGRKFWKLSPNFIEKEGLILSMTEMLSLFLSQQLFSPLSGTQLGGGLTSALDKIKAQLPVRTLNYFEDLDSILLVKSPGFHDYSDQDREIRLLYQATSEERELSIQYRSNGKRAIWESRFHPYGMIFNDGGLYCIGNVLKDREIRTLKVDRLGKVKTTELNFNRPKFFSLRQYVGGGFGIIADRTPMTFRVKFTGWAVSVVREKIFHHTQKITASRDDSLTVEYRLTNPIEFKRWILSFGRQARVLSPEEFRKDIVMELQTMQILYSDL
jgi:predicted DNA-binding transcriptional regulator YafY